MKKYIYIIGIILSSAMMFSSCEKQLDVSPDNSVDADEALKTSGDVKAALVGAYTAAGLPGLYGGQTMASTELLANSGDFSFFGTFSGYNQLDNKAIEINNNFVEETWNDAYNTINACNNVLNSLALIEEANKDRVEGEAKFLRGMVYFDLARLFGKAWNDGIPGNNPAVPIVLLPTTAIDSTSNLSRNSVAQVYAQAIADLTDAKAKLPQSNGFFANTYSASAILARIYLTQENFDLALAESEVVIDEGGFSLLEEYVDEFPVPEPASRVSNTSEDIFAVQLSSQAGFNSLTEEFASADFGGRGDIEINDQHFERYESDDDERLAAFYDDIYTAKFNNQYGNIKLIRLAEMYLIRAEANIRKASPNLVNARSDLDVVRERSNLNPTTARSSNALLAAVQRERLVELAFEGFRLHDAKRYKQNIGELTFDSPDLVYPIPQREIQANPNLTQNSGY